MNDKIFDFSSFLDLPIVDGHVHFVHQGRMDEILALMRRAHCGKLNLVCVPNPDATTHNPQALYFKTCKPETTYISGALDYSTVLDNRSSASGIFAQQIINLKKKGFDGLKLIEGKPNVRKMTGIPLDGIEYEGMWYVLEKEAFPVVFHVGDPEEFWDRENCPAWARDSGWDYSAGGFPAREALYDEIDHILARHPRLKIIFAHFYFLSSDLKRSARFLDDNPTVLFDLAPHIEMYRHFSADPEASKAFFERFQDRIVYGTDIDTRVLERGKDGYSFMLSIPWLIRSFLEKDGAFSLSGKEKYAGMGLGKNILEKIYYINFETLYGVRPAPLEE